MPERHIRSIAKTISWRVIATLTTFIIVWIATGDLFISIGVGVLDIMAKLILYYAHERVWLKVKWGRKQARSSKPL